MPATLHCPICKKEVKFDAPEMPFCSKRCRMIDIGNWADERYVISGGPSQPEFAEENERSGVNRLAVALATWFGSGYFPWGPGTVGSLAALVIFIALHAWYGAGRVTLITLILTFLWPGVWASTRAARLWNTKDPGKVVVDEVLGQWLTLLGAVAFSWKTFLAGFILFRLFDIWKPWPVRRFESMPDGVGIVADDLAAGVYGAVVLSVSGSLGFY